MLIRHIWFVLLLACNAWCANATKDSLVNITQELLKRVEKTKVAFYLPDDDNCSKTYRNIPVELMEKGVMFQTYEADVVPNKHVFIIGCFEFIRNLWTKLSRVLTPSHTVAVISKDFTGTGKFLKHNSHVGIRLILVTQRKDATWIIRRTIYNSDKTTQYVHVASVPKDLIPPSKELYPVPTFHGWLIRIFLRNVWGRPVLCHGKWWRKSKGRIQDSVLVLLREYMQICYVAEDYLTMPVGKLRKGKWTGTFGLLQKNEIDLAGKIFVLNAQRAHHFDMTEWFDIGKVKMTGSGPTIIVKPFIVFEVFTTHLWIFITVSIIVLSYLRWVIGSLEFIILSTIKEDPLIRKRSRVYYFMQTFSMLVWRGIPETRSEERMWGLRVSTVTTSLMVFILMAVYCNNITSFLAVPQMSKPINTLEDLLARPDVTPMIRPGNSHYAYIHTSPLKSIQKLRAIMDSNPNESYVELYAAEINEKCISGKYVYISSDSYAKFIASKELIKLHVSSGHLKWDMYSLAFQKNGPFTERANMGIRRIKQFGLVVEVMKEFDLLDVKPPISDSKLVLGLLHLQGAFYILFVGITVSVITFVGERIYEKQKVKRGDK